MSETLYLLAAVAIGFAITLGLRALPFVALKKLRESEFVEAMATWMPAGILFILALATLQGSATEDEGRLGQALAAVGVTVAVHLLGGRRTLLSVASGTIVFVVLVNL
jgi:branched-subunit amino acid transport protein AzlD